MNGTMGTIVYFLIIIAIFYFLLIRPQSKARKERTSMIDGLQVGDKVYTVGGIIGTLTKVADNSVFLKVANDVEVEVLKTGIGGLKKENE